MKRRIVSFALAVALVFGLSVGANAATTEQNRAAEALYHLGLFQGRSTTVKDFDLDNPDGLNRAEGTLLVIRLLGKETEAYTRDLANTPFPDVADFWKGNAPFIAYAYEEGLMKGVETHANGVITLTFEPRAAMNDRMYLTLILRVLSYPDQDNYIWKNAYKLGYEAGLVDSAEKDAEFLRGDAALVAWKALGAKLYGSTKTLADKLRSEGLFTAAEYAEAKEIWETGYLEDDTTTTPTTPVTPGVPDDSGSGDTTTPENGESDGDTEVDGEFVLSAASEPTAEAYEAYLAMVPEDQVVFFASFANPMDYVNWLDAAMKAYDDAQNKIEIDVNTSIDIGDLLAGQN